MTIITDFKQQVSGPSSVALGCFDGVHLGHQKVIDRTVQDKINDLVPSVFTFQEHPAVILTGKQASLLVTPDDKKRLFAEMGIEQVFMPPFEKMMDIEAEDFVRIVLKDMCKAVKVYCGFNFYFGKGAKAGTESLKSFGAKYGVAVEIIEPVTADHNVPISSTKIRSYLKQGEVRAAAAMLGRCFSFHFPVIEGNKLGRKMNVPTINQSLPPNFVKPKRGVYASLVTLQDGRVYYGITNIGVKPTLGANYDIGSETWMPDFSGNLYGATPKTELVSFIREEQKFSDLNALSLQIQQDKQVAFAILQEEFPQYRRQ